MTWLSNKAFGIVLTLLLMLGLLFQTAMSQNNTKTVEMKGTDDLKFSVTEITVEPGQKVHVKLTTISDLPKKAMAHNFVLLTAGADVTAVVNKSARAADNEYIAPEVTDQIIAYTAMGGGGETVEVTFEAPEDPGKYEYVCTFPGHYAGGMKGTLIVKEN